MMLAGLPVRDQDVLEIARPLRDAGFDDTAGRLEDAYDVECKVLALKIADRGRSSERSTIHPTGLAELRGVLVREHEWRVQHGLVERLGECPSESLTSAPAAQAFVPRRNRVGERSGDP